jgi:hypothetical protein
MDNGISEARTQVSNLVVPCLLIMWNVFVRTPRAPNASVVFVVFRG